MAGLTRTYAKCRFDYSLLQNFTTCNTKYINEVCMPYKTQSVGVASSAFATLQGMTQAPYVDNGRRALAGAGTTSNVSAALIDGTSFVPKLLGVADQTFVDTITATGPKHKCTRDVMRCAHMCMLAMYGGDARSYCEYYSGEPFTR